MYTLNEVAKIFHVTRQTIYNWISAGRIKVVKIGGVVRVSEEEVERVKQGSPEESKG